MPTNEEFPSSLPKIPGNIFGEVDNNLNRENEVVKNFPLNEFAEGDVQNTSYVFRIAKWARELMVKKNRYRKSR